MKPIYLLPAMPSRPLFFALVAVGLFPLLLLLCVPRIAHGESLDPQEINRILSRCTEEYQPVQCHAQVNDQNYSAAGANRCEALQELTTHVNTQARWFMTLRPQDFPKVVCQPLGSP